MVRAVLPQRTNLRRPPPKMFSCVQTMGCALGSPSLLTEVEGPPKLHSHYMGDFVFWNAASGGVESGSSANRIIRVVQDAHHPTRMGYAYIGEAGSPAIPDFELTWNTGYLSQGPEGWKAVLRGPNGSDEEWKISHGAQELESCYWSSKRFWKGTFHAVDLGDHAAGACSMGAV